MGAHAATDSAPAPQALSNKKVGKVNPHKQEPKSQKGKSKAVVPDRSMPRWMSLVNQVNGVTSSGNEYVPPPSAFIPNP